MKTLEEHLSPDPYTPYELLNARWTELCDRYLPVVAAADSVWRYSRQSMPSDPEQGWKLHVPATVLTATRMLQTVAPFLSSCDTLYKAPSSLDELDKLNSGIFYGYSQVGKFLTVYPRTNGEAVLLARKLHQLTCSMPAPCVPFDLKYRPGSCVYYRYGAFKLMEMADADGGQTFAIRDPRGNLIPDVRESATAKPDWVADPFTPRRKSAAAASEQIESPLKTTFKAFRALSQRGRGGVYQALDLSALPPRLCVLKEGRKDGEVSWDGRDGRWRVRHEQRVLTALREANINVPIVYASFETEGNYYVAVEFIEGDDLGKWLQRKKRRLPVALALRRGIEIARLMSSIHAAGWVWRDCKPHNIVVARNGELRALDFEGACPVNQPDPLPWGTPSYIAPEVTAPFRGQSRLPEDLYSLGAVIYLLLVGCTPEAGARELFGGLKRKIPDGAREVVAELLGSDPSRRPAAQIVAERLEATRAPSAMLSRARDGALRASA